MPFHIISLKNIPITNSANIGVYKLHKYEYRSIIPFNCMYNLYILPYFNNSPYTNMDFYNVDDFNYILDMGIKTKSISKKTYQIGKYYIPNLPSGNLVSNIIVPIPVNICINPINKPFIINSIYTYSKNIVMDYHIKTLFINIKTKINDTYSKEIIEIPFLLYDISVSEYYKIIKWVPTHQYIINCDTYFEIDVREFYVSCDVKRDNIEIFYTFNP